MTIYTHQHVIVAHNRWTSRHRNPDSCLFHEPCWPYLISFPCGHHDSLPPFSNSQPWGHREPPVHPPVGFESLSPFHRLGSRPRLSLSSVYEYCIEWLIDFLEFVSVCICTYDVCMYCCFLSSLLKLLEACQGRPSVNLGRGRVVVLKGEYLGRGRGRRTLDTWSCMYVCLGVHDMWIHISLYNMYDIIYIYIYISHMNA